MVKNMTSKMISIRDDIYKNLKKLMKEQLRKEKRKTLLFLLQNSQKSGEINYDYRGYNCYY